MTNIEGTRTALIAVDVQNDFCPGGSLAVTEGDLVVPSLNDVIRFGRKEGWTLVATRDWHPEKTSHFAKYGGVWPEHCVQGTKGGAFHKDLDLEGVEVFSKGMGEKEDAYSGFEARNPVGLDLELFLQRGRVGEIVVGGLATDYCVKATVVQGLEKGFRVALLTDAIRAVNIDPEDGKRAIEEMVAKGAVLKTTRELIGGR